MSIKKTQYSFGVSELFIIFANDITINLECLYCLYD